MNQEIRTQMKLDLVDWFKANYKGVQIRRRILKYIVRALTHEVIHYKIYERFGKGMESEISMNLTKDELFFGCDFECHGTIL